MVPSSTAATSEAAFFMPQTKEPISIMVSTSTTATSEIKLNLACTLNNILMSSTVYYLVHLELSSFKHLLVDVLKHKTMDSTQAYAIALGSIFSLIIIAKILPQSAQSLHVYCVPAYFVPLIDRFINHVALWISTHLTYQYLINRHRFWGPWIRADVLVQLAYVTANSLSLGFKSSISEAGIRAGTLSLINLIPLLAGLHLSFLADLLGVSLSTYKLVHRSSGVMTSLLVLFHILVMLGTGASFPFDNIPNRFALIAACSLCLLFLLPYFLGKSYYEIFLRTHQGLAVLLAYATWRHITSSGVFPRFYLYISAGIFMITLIIQVGGIIRNGVFTGFSRAKIRRVGDAVWVHIKPQKPLYVKTGQYINLWVPVISPWSFLQSHPFVVTSWKDGLQHTLDLFVEPRRGLTLDLFEHGKDENAKESIVLFSGPHGSSILVNEYETVFMVASGFGIAALLPYLSQLINSHCTSRVRLIWQIRDLEVGVAAQPLLNSFLDADKDSHNLGISIYHLQGNVKGSESEVPFGKSGRATVFHGPAPLEDIFGAEVEREHIGGLPGSYDPTNPKRMLVLVSSSGDIRDRLRVLVQGYLDKNVRLLELDYQPDMR